jgi:hypothetical protein
MEAAFTDFNIQRHIHDVIVVVHEGPHSEAFHLFFKNHCHMKFNKTVAALERNIERNRLWRGDIVVMRAGKGIDSSVVNMRGRDSGLADFIIKQ